ncbi:uncharacterized protein PG986_013838 [Apiospora aurea]|uniref:F-box domain-containing protein n=1 Tax=Apiospora aurea TaxID=335848 RepID=A0ABR1PX92_9PEZI
MADTATKKGGLRALLGLRSSKEPGTRRKLTKRKSTITFASPDPDKLDSASISTRRSSMDSASRLRPASPQQSRLTKAQRAPTQPRHLLDKDTGERKDLTEMMHALTYSEDLDAIDEAYHHRDSLEYDPSKPDGTARLASLSPELWLRVAEYLSPLDVARLSSTCRTMAARLGSLPYRLLRDQSNRSDRLDFLLAMDKKLPRHLFCFPCAQWHLRIQPGLESLRPQNVLNPLFECPNRKNAMLPPPRIRITEGRTLPFAFVQLAKRHWALGPDYGIAYQSLGRRWKEPSFPNWAHSTAYHITDQGHVLMRVTSQVFVEGGLPDAAKRNLLFSRDEYTPYFSVCSHWKAGELTSVPKCALDHIPVEDSGANKLDLNLKNRLVAAPVPRKPAGLIPTCGHCKPIRRCPCCPTEYLFELKTAEDRSVAAANGPGRFRLALTVTRWSDLGPARRPDADREWAAIAGTNSADDEYDSFAEMGRRSINGTFEGAFTDTVPGRRIVSANPKNVKEDEMGGGGSSFGEYRERVNQIGEWDRTWELRHRVFDYSLFHVIARSGKSFV